MANEASVLSAFGDLEYFGWTAASALTRGTVCVLSPDATSSTMQVKWHAAANEIFAGIAEADNIAGEASGNVTLRTRGRFKMKAGGTISEGDAVILGSTANQVIKANLATLTYTDLFKIVGMALCDSTSGNDVIVWRP